MKLPRRGLYSRPEEKNKYSTRFHMPLKDAPAIYGIFQFVPRLNILNHVQI